MGLSLQDFQKLPQKVGTENYSKRLKRNVCKNVSARPTDLFCRFCWNDSARSLFPAATTQLFPHSPSSHNFCCCLEIVPTTNNSATSGTTNSYLSAPMSVAAGTIYLHRNGISLLPITSASAPNPRPRFRPTPL